MHVLMAASLEIVGLFALFVCWVGALWELSIPTDSTAYSAQAAAPLTGRANDVLLVVGVALGMLVLIGIGALVGRRMGFAAIQFLAVIVVIFVTRHDLVWAYHVTHPLAPPRAPLVNYTPCFSGSNTCN